MKAKDVMVRDVATVTPATLVREAARLMVERRISGLPVVDGDGHVLGIVSEGDLLHRAETGTERRRSWWLQVVAGSEELAQDYIKSHAGRVGDVMTRRVVTVGEDTDLAQVATQMERRNVKRLPVVRDGRLVGIVSRADLVRAYLLSSAPLGPEPVTDADIRKRLDEILEREPWLGSALLNISVDGGAVDLGGCVPSEEERRALQVAVETVPGVKSVRNYVVVRPAGYGY
jgi:CBS domain-containing protein